MAEPLGNRPSDSPGPAGDNCDPTIEAEEPVDVAGFCKVHHTLIPPSLVPEHLPKSILRYFK